jgi:hypothetical protein
MNLRRKDRQALELRIVGYEFPDAKIERHSSDWLVVRISVSHPRGTWTTEDPCLLTDEAARLAGWLESVGKAEFVESEIGFTEPNLEFCLITPARGAALRVYFELELRPEWAYARGAGARDLFVEFPVAELDLSAAVRSLRKQLECFPPRTSH